MPDAWPDPVTVAALYERMAGGDRIAQSEFLAAVLDPLAHHLRAWRPDADEHLCITAAEDALLSLIRNPSSYDPAKRGLIGYLRMAAEGDFLNLLQKEGKHRRNRDPRESVELAAVGGNEGGGVLPDAFPSFDDPKFAAEIAGFTPPERAVFELMRGGERRTTAFAAALGVGHLPPDEETREVKRVKDRIIKRLQRAGRKA